MSEPTKTEKLEAIQKYFDFGDNTIQFFNFYKWRDDLINKLYNKIPEDNK